MRFHKIQSVLYPGAVLPSSAEDEPTESLAGEHGRKRIRRDGLEVAVFTGVPQGGVELGASHYRIVSVQSGSGQVRMGHAETEVGEYHHFAFRLAWPVIFRRWASVPSFS